MTLGGSVLLIYSLKKKKKKKVINGSTRDSSQISNKRTAQGLSVESNHITTKTIMFKYLIVLSPLSLEDKQAMFNCILLWMHPSILT